MTTKQWRIVNNTSEAAMLEQTIEEAGELIQAAAKRLRILRGESPTPILPEDNLHSLTEEVADVELCLELLPVYAMTESIDVFKNAKIDRWVKRLEDKEAEK